MLTFRQFIKKIIKKILKKNTIKFKIHKTDKRNLYKEGSIFFINKYNYIRLVKINIQYSLGSIYPLSVCYPKFN